MAVPFSFKITAPPRSGSGSGSVLTTGGGSASNHASRVSSPLSRTNESNSSSHQRQNRPRAWASRGQSDSESESDELDDGRGGRRRSKKKDQDELVTGFDLNNGLTRRKESKNKVEEPLVILSEPNRDWREAAEAVKRRKAQGRYIPDAVGGMRIGSSSSSSPLVTPIDLGTTDVINSTPITGGLEMLSAKKITEIATPMDIDGGGGDIKNTVTEEVKTTVTTTTPITSNAIEGLALTEEQRALRELMAGEQEHQEQELDAILPSGPDSRFVSLDEGSAFKNDLLSRPDESTLEDYARVPVGQFGAALMRGMGWREGQVASNRRSGPVEAFVPKSRPALLGIGAKPMSEIMGEEKGKNGKSVRRDRREDMKFVPLVRRSREEITNGSRNGIATASGHSTPALTASPRRSLSPPGSRPRSALSSRHSSPPFRSSSSRTEDERRRRRDRDSDRDSYSRSDGKRPRARSRSPGRGSGRDRGGDRDRDRDRKRDRGEYRDKERTYASRSKSPRDDRGTRDGDGQHQRRN